MVRLDMPTAMVLWVLWVGLLSQLSECKDFACARFTEPQDLDVRLMNLSIERVALTDLQASFTVSSEKIDLAKICSQWQTNLQWLDLHMLSTIPLCDCEFSGSLNSAVCRSQIRRQPVQKTVFHMEVFLKQMDVEGCDSMWVREHQVIDLEQQKCAKNQSPTVPEDFAHSAGGSEFDWMCEHLPSMQGSSPKAKNVHNRPILVTAADSLLPRSVTALSALLRSIHADAPQQHIVACDTGPDDLEQKLRTVNPELDQYRNLVFVHPRWGVLPSFARGLAFRSICMASVLCTHKHALWVDPDASFPADLTSYFNLFSNDGHLLVSLPPAVSQPSCRGSQSTGHAQQAGEDGRRVSMMHFGFSRDGSAFNAVFLPALGVIVRALSCFKKTWDGEEEEEVNCEGARLRGREEWTVAGKLEQRVLTAAVGAARREGVQVATTNCEDVTFPFGMQRPANTGAGGRDTASGRMSRGTWVERECDKWEGGTEAGLSELMRLSATDKLWKHAYNRYYQRALDELRHRKGIRLLELGLGGGHSLDVWLNYFSDPDAIHVLSHDPVPWSKRGSKRWACSVHADRCAAVRFFEGDQGNATVMDRVLREGARMPHLPPVQVPAPSDSFWDTGGYDVVVDDASHFPAYQIYSMIRLLPAVRPGGLYIIEDFETSYYDGEPLTLFGLPITGAGVGKPPPGNAVSKLKELVDVIMRGHIGDERLSVLGAEVDGLLLSVEFGDGIVVLRKETLEEAMHRPQTPASQHKHVDFQALATWAREAEQTNPRPPFKF